MNTESIVIERAFNATADFVWNAISNVQQMKEWYFDINSFKPEIGFEFHFYGGSETKRYLHLCKITDVIPGKKLAYSWRYDGYEGNTLVTFEIFSENDKTRLKLTHEGVDSFPSDNPDLAKENFVEGWTHIIGTSLKEYLEKKLTTST